MEGEEAWLDTVFTRALGRAVRVTSTWWVYAKLTRLFINGLMRPVVGRDRGGNIRMAVVCKMGSIQGRSKTKLSHLPPHTTKYNRRHSWSTPGSKRKHNVRNRFPIGRPL